jgi:hypothetical protein
MRAVVVYESMYGNTRVVAEAIASALRTDALVSVLPVGEAAPDTDALRHIDLLVVGAPTHAWGLSRPSTRKGAADAAAKPGSALRLEPGAEGPGLREWLEPMPCIPTRVATFDTRMRAPMGLSGSAARKAAQQIRRQGFQLAAPPEGFYVTKQNTLEPGELERARAWARNLATEWAKQSV